jgi:hypothetical protein
VEVVDELLGTQDFPTVTKEPKLAPSLTTVTLPLGKGSSNFVGHGGSDYICLRRPSLLYNAHRLCRSFPADFESILDHCSQPFFPRSSLLSLEGNSQRLAPHAHLSNPSLVAQSSLPFAHPSSISLSNHVSNHPPPINTNLSEHQLSLRANYHRQLAAA